MRHGEGLYDKQRSGEEEKVSKITPRLMEKDGETREGLACMGLGGSDSGHVPF